MVARYSIGPSAWIRVVGDGWGFFFEKGEGVACSLLACYIHFEHHGFVFRTTVASGGMSGA